MSETPKRKRLSDAEAVSAVQACDCGDEVGGHCQQCREAAAEDHLQAREDRNRLAEALRESATFACHPFGVEDLCWDGVQNCLRYEHDHPRCKRNRALLAEVTP